MLQYSSQPASTVPYQSHIERTATSTRDHGLHPVTLTNIHLVNSNIRLFRLRIDDQARGVKPLYPVHKIQTVKLHRLTSALIIAAEKFLPGQWLDVFVPGLHKPGGFTITSAPQQALPPSARARPVRSRPPLESVHQLAPSTAVSSSPSSSQSTPPPPWEQDDGDAYLELAVQDSPSNPPAAWLWRDEASILGQQLLVRVGGNFVWPPPDLDVLPENLVLVAGGVGINPLISILTHLHLTNSMPQSVTMLYSSKSPPPASNSAAANTSSILFLDRILSIAAYYPSLPSSSFSSSSTSSPPTTTTSTQPPTPSSNFHFHLHLTTPLNPQTQHQTQRQNQQPPTPPTNNLTHHKTRPSTHDLLSLLPSSPASRRKTACYVCGPRAMTDEVVAIFEGVEGVGGEGRVFCEKWW